MSRGKSSKGGSWRLGPEYQVKIDEAYKRAASPADEGEGTTCMLKNIPNKYSRAMLVDRMLALFAGTVNFIYMPIDFSTECNVGYAFINFRTRAAADKFTKEFDSVHTKECLPGYNSNKIAQVSLAAVQGLRANMDHLSKSALLPMLNMHEPWYLLKKFLSLKLIVVGLLSYEFLFSSGFNPCFFLVCCSPQVLLK